jgi:hypothetical protein
MQDRIKTGTTSKHNLQRLLCPEGLLRVSGGPGCTVQKTEGHPVTALGWSYGTINKF